MACNEPLLSGHFHHGLLDGNNRMRDTSLWRRQLPQASLAIAIAVGSMAVFGAASLLAQESKPPVRPAEYGRDREIEAQRARRQEISQ